MISLPSEPSQADSMHYGTRGSFSRYYNPCHILWALGITSSRHLASAQPHGWALIMPLCTDADMAPSVKPRNPIKPPQKPNQSICLSCKAVQGTARTKVLPRSCFAALSPVILPLAWAPKLMRTQHWQQGPAWGAGRHNPTVCVQVRHGKN